MCKCLKVVKVPFQGEGLLFQGEEMPFRGVEVAYQVTGVPFQNVECPFRVWTCPFTMWECPFRLWECPFIVLGVAFSGYWHLRTPIHTYGHLRTCVHRWWKILRTLPWVLPCAKNKYFIISNFNLFSFKLSQIYNRKITLLQLIKGVLLRLT